MTASTTVVSARVDAATAERAAACIKASGLTVGEVIKRIWERIAETGELPDFQGAEEKADAFERLHALQARLVDVRVKDAFGDSDA